VSATGVLSVEDVTFAYGSGPTVLKDASLTVPPGCSIGLVGESGSGKTTLASLLVGLLQPTVGSVTVDGTPWKAVKRTSDLRRAVQMIFQNPYTALNPRMTALRTVSEVFECCRGLATREAEEQARSLLDRVGIEGAALDKLPRNLSGGQCQRVGIARALAAGPTVIVADEPTSALDVSVQAQILNLLGDLRREQGLSLVLVSHDLDVVKYLTEDALVMDQGEIVERGPTAQLFSSPQHPCTRALLDSIL
jgi:ABC-type dipeptide/oligopeptide/nickel transport system ATPase subunit